MHRAYPQYAEERDNLLERLRTALLADARVVGVRLAGSIGRRTADDMSDLDLWIAIDDTAISNVAAAPETFVHALIPTIMEIHAPSIAPVGGAFLLTWVAGKQGPQQVDWYFQAASSVRRPLHTRVVFERRRLPTAEVPPRLADDALERAIDDAIRDTLLMIFITSKHIVRNNPWHVMRHLEHVARCLGKLELLVGCGAEPAVDDPFPQSLPEVLPCSPDAQRRLLSEFRRRLVKLVTQSGRVNRFATAIQAVDAALSARN